MINPYAFGGGGGGSGDPFFANVVLLVDASHYTNGTTPAGLDVTGKTATYRNNAQIKTDQFKFGTSSLYLDGTNDRVAFADSADWAMGMGAFTYEIWVRREFDSLAAQQALFYQSNTFGGFVSAGMILGTLNDTTMRVSDGSVSDTNNAGTLLAGVWSHLAMVYDGSGTLYRFQDGVHLHTSTGLTGFTMLDSTGSMTIGAFTDADNPFHFQGWVDQFRITKGVARYVADFTPPTAIFPHTA